MISSNSYSSILVTLVLLTIFLWCSCCTVIHTSAEVPSNRSVPQPITVVSNKYRCFRSFESLDTFSAVALNPKDNCHFDYIRIISANASISCYGPRNSAVGGVQEGSTPSVVHRTSDTKDYEKEKQGCYGTISFIASSPTHDEYSPGKGHIIGDEARYTLRLHSIGNSAIHYKGEGGGQLTGKEDGVNYVEDEEDRWHGYSVCCALLEQPQYGECTWTDTETSLKEMEDKPLKKLVMKYCALHKKDLPQDGSLEDEPDLNDPLGLHKRDKNLEKKILASRRRMELKNEDEDKGEVSIPTFSGSVRKPLHKAVAGKWNTELRLFRGAQPVGRLSVLLTLTEEMLNAAGLDQYGSESTPSRNRSETVDNTNSLDVMDERKQNAITTVPKDVKEVKKSAEDDL